MHISLNHQLLQKSGQHVMVVFIIVLGSDALAELRPARYS